MIRRLIKNERRVCEAVCFCFSDLFFLSQNYWGGERGSIPDVRYSGGIGTNVHFPIFALKRKKRMPEIKVLSVPTPVEYLRTLASEQYMDMVKGVVDVEKEIIAVGGSLHSDEESFLLESGSLQQNLWGINIYFDVEEQDRIEFDSMINLRPSAGNKTRGIDNLELQNRIRYITNHLIIF
jgi:hypothetical protein